MSSPGSQSKGLFYGWYIAAAIVIIAVVGNGARTSFGAFLLPMETHFGWDRSTISLAASIAFLLGGLSQPFMGQALDRFGGRNVIGLSLLVMGLSTALLSLTFNFFFLLFMFGFVSSIALSGASTTNTGAVLARWFRRRRATVMGLNTAGVSVGGLVIAPCAVFLIQRFDWRVSWAALGLAILVLAVPLAYLVLRENPRDMGLEPDGDPEPAGGGAAARERLRPPLEADVWHKAMRSPPFWQLTGALSVCGATTAIISTHFIAFADDQSVPAGRAAVIFGLMMFMNAFGSISVGILSDRFSPKNLLAATYFTRGMAYVVLLTFPAALGVWFQDMSRGILGVELLTAPGELKLWIFAFVAGISWIATNPPTTTLTADIYGLRVLATIGGISFLFHQIGGATTILLAGLLYDATGSYTLPFALAGSLLFPAALSAFTIKERKYSSRYQTAAPAPAPS